MFNCVFSCFGYDIEIQDADLNGKLWTIETDEPERLGEKNIELQEFRVNAVYKQYSTRQDAQNLKELQHLVKK